MMVADPNLRNAAVYMGGVEPLLNAEDDIAEYVLRNTKVDERTAAVVKVNRKLSKARALVWSKSKQTQDGHTFACVCVQRWFTIGLGTLMQERKPLKTAKCLDGKTALQHLFEQCERECSPAQALTCVHYDRKLFLMELKK